MPPDRPGLRSRTTEVDGRSTVFRRFAGGCLLPIGFAGRLA
jgi:hypothetical protein